MTGAGDTDDALEQEASGRLAGGDLDGARETLRRLLLSDPERAAAHRLLGQLFSARREHARALESYERALDLDPGDTAARDGLASAKAYVAITKDPDYYSVEEERPWAPDACVWEELAGHPTLVVLFSGLGIDHRPPTFIFRNFLSTYSHLDKLFLRDLEKLWFLNGLGGLTSTVQETADFLRRKAQRHERVVFIGCSAGATAAILYGEAVGADKVLAFAPQAVLTEDKERECGDHRWPRYLRDLRRSPVDPKYLDLRSLGPFSVPIDIHFSAGCDADRCHAQRIEGKSLRRFPHEGSGHVVAMHLRDTGRLRAILDEEIPPEARF